MRITFAPGAYDALAHVLQGTRTRKGDSPLRDLQVKVTDNIGDVIHGTVQNVNGERIYLSDGDYGYDLALDDIAEVRVF